MNALFLCFSPYLGSGGGGGVSRGLGHNLLLQFSNLGSSKMEFSETDFFDTLTIQNDQSSYIKHGFALLYVFFTLFGYWLCWGGGRGRGLPRDPGHNLLLQFPSLGSSKMELSTTDFFDTLTIQNDQISHIKHGLAPLYVFLPYLGVRGGGPGGGGGGGLSRGPGTICFCSLRASEAQKRNFPKLVFLTL